MSTELELTGLDGANPLAVLAVLAALGTLRTLTLAWPRQQVRLGWRRRDVWRPVLTASTPLTLEGVVDTLHVALQQMRDHPALTRWDNLSKIPPADYRRYAQDAATQGSPQDRRWVDFAAALANDVIADDVGVLDTAFRTMSGAGHQDFLKFMRQLVMLTEPEHLREALVGPWRYKDDKPSMRWDPADDRRYALRWSDPSPDPIKTVRGANRLAIEGLPLWPVMPIETRLETTGYRGRKSRDAFWTWPIWLPPVSLDVARSLLAMPELLADKPQRDALETMGVKELYRAQRITVGKFRNFTAGQPV